MKVSGEPDAGNLYVRFDEGGGDPARSPPLLYRRNEVMNQVLGSLAAAQFLTLHSPVFQSPSTMSLQSTPVGHGPADLFR